MAYVLRRNSYLDKSTPFITYRWVGFGVLFLMFTLRIVFAQGWYIGKSCSRSIALTQFTDKLSRLLPRHLPPQPLPSLHLPEIRPLPRSRHRNGRRRTRRPSLRITDKERPRVQALRTTITRVQVLAFSDARDYDRLPV